MLTGLPYAGCCVNGTSYKGVSAGLEDGEVGYAYYGKDVPYCHTYVDGTVAYYHDKMFDIPNYQERTRLLKFADYASGSSYSVTCGSKGTALKSRSADGYSVYSHDTFEDFFAKLASGQATFRNNL